MRVAGVSQGFVKASHDAGCKEPRGPDASALAADLVIRIRGRQQLTVYMRAYHRGRLTYPSNDRQAAHEPSWSLAHYDRSASAEQYYRGEDVREHSDMLKAISVHLERMIRSGQGVEYAASQRSR